MKIWKNLRQFLFVMTLTGLALVCAGSLGGLTAPAALAQGIFPLPSPESYGNVPAPVGGGTAQQQFAQLVWGVVQNVRFIIGAVAILMIVYAGFRMVTGWGKEDVYTKQRSNIFYAIVGLAVVALAGEAANILSVACPEAIPGQPAVPCTPGGFISNPNAVIRTATLFNQRTQIIITFIKYFIGAVAVLMIVRNGLRMVTMGGSEEKIELDKKNLLYSVLGLGFIILADTVISQVFYKIDLSRYPTSGGAQPGVDAARGVAEIVGFTNFAVTLVSPIAVLALVAGGVMYITSAGDEEKMNKAKRLIMAALIGIIVIYGAFAIVSTFISGSFEGATGADAALG
ncbi:MAG TPA: hypothetical protein VI588_01455 [Candidatus Gracilibacteria bacterium]|nr:hypothetical protein [Candidatus Gracilibacteria bacterium]